MNKLLRKIKLTNMCLFILADSLFVQGHRKSIYFWSTFFFVGKISVDYCLRFVLFCHLLVILFKSLHIFIISIYDFISYHLEIHYFIISLSDLCFIYINLH